MENEDINDAIFNVIKTNLTNDVNPETFLKICLGTATEEEKKQIELPEEVIQKLKTCCDTGYNMASSLDKERNEVNILKSEMEELKLEMIELKKEVTELKNKIVEKEIDYNQVQYM